MKKQNVMDEEWDYLIILDACRYDYFEKVYDEYLDGKLEKRNSEAGATPEWLYKTFTDDYDYFDISYFSVNPFVNSLRYSLLDISNTDYDWCASDIFPHIVDLWNGNKWDDNRGTIYPDDVVDSYLDTGKMQRSIIHFIQPHLPFIHPESKMTMEWGAKKSIELDSDNSVISLFKRIRNFAFYDVLRSILSNKKMQWRLRKIFGVPALHRYEEVFHLGQGDRIEEFYEHSIRKTLGSVERLIPKLNGKTVITADHGECHGEYNLWGHENENHNPILTTVPWLKVIK